MVATPVKNQTISVTYGTDGAKIASGRTQPGATNWQVYHVNAIYVDVDTSAAGFTQTPVYVTSIGGDSQHYGTDGASAVYSATATGFRIFIKWDTGYKNSNAITPEEANASKWHINWIAIEPNTGRPTPGKYYYIGNKNSGKYLDVEGASTADGANIQQYSKAAVDQQQWEFQDAGNGYYYIISKKSGKAVGVAGGSTGNTADGANVIQWAKVATADDQKWKLEDAGNGYFYIVNKNSGKVLDVAGSSLVDKGNVLQYQKANGDNQKWKFEAV